MPVKKILPREPRVVPPVPEKSYTGLHVPRLVILTNREGGMEVRGGLQWGIRDDATGEWTDLDESNEGRVQLHITPEEMAAIIEAKPALAGAVDAIQQALEDYAKEKELI